MSIIVLNGGHLNPFYSFSSKIHFYNIDVSGNPLAYFLKYTKGIQKLVKSINPTVISVCDDGLKGFFLPKLISTNAKWIYERHASIALNTSSSLEGVVVAKIMQSQVKNFDAFVVLTHSNIKEWKGNNVLAIPNPLSFEIGEERSSLENKRVISVGSHSYNKGFDTLLEIWRNIEQNHNEWELHIYGKIDVDQTFIKQADKLELKRVFFHDPVKDIKSKFLESSIMVLPSRSEGFGMVLIEAMACGVPCIAFDCPSGPRDIINHKVNGILVENQNKQAFQSELEEIITNHERRRNYGEHSLQSISKYRVNDVIKQWINLFDKLYGKI